MEHIFQVDLFYFYCVRLPAHVSHPGFVCVSQSVLLLQHIIPFLFFLVFVVWYDAYPCWFSFVMVLVLALLLLLLSFVGLILFCFSFWLPVILRLFFFYFLSVVVGMWQWLYILTYLQWNCVYLVADWQFLFSRNKTKQNKNKFSKRKNSIRTGTQEQQQ